jgi:hypothetical protein
MAYPCANLVDRHIVGREELGHVVAQVSLDSCRYLGADGSFEITAPDGTDALVDRRTARTATIGNPLLAQLAVSSQSMSRPPTSLIWANPRSPLSPASPPAAVRAWHWPATS